MHTVDPTARDERGSSGRRVRTMRSPNFSDSFVQDRAALAAALDAQGAAASLRHVCAYLDGAAERQRQERRRAGVPLSPQAARQSQQIIEAVRIALGAVVGASAATESEPPRREAPAPRLMAVMRLLLGRDHWPPEPSAAAPTRQPLHVDPTRLLDAVGDALAAGAQAIEDAEPPAEPRDVWATDQELLGVLQGLLAARGRGDHREIFLRLEALEADLRLRHGIRAVAYDGANEKLFGFAPSPDPDDQRYVTRSPALVTADDLLRRGEVTAPSEAVSGRVVRS